VLVHVSDRFRDLELSGRAGRKDAVLLATVASFEAMPDPSKRDLKQFADLFVPLFEAASEEAKRTAAAALSRAPIMPEAASRLILDQPVGIAAPFIVHSSAIDESMLIEAVQKHGVAHARAAARRRSVSPQLLAALSAIAHPAVKRTLSLRGTSAAAAEPASRTPSAVERQAREEDIRNKLRSIVMRNTPDYADPPILPARIAPDVESRLIRHVEEGDTIYFATALADALASRFDLAERIMMDVSGAQLAQTLVALGLRYTMIIAALERFFPHLADGQDGERRSLQLLRSCSFVECVEKVMAWQRADWVSRRATHQPVVADSARRDVRADQSPKRNAGQRGVPLRRA
jgi:uncharacterized protein (DUF2336 family)